MKLLQKLMLAALLSLGVSAAYAGTDMDNQDVEFPEMDRAWLESGTFVDVENLRRMGHGMTPNQIRELISYPHFSEGMGLSNWNYIFNFRTGKGEEYVVCQYQVQFNDGKSSKLYWKENVCEQFIAAKAPAPVNMTAPITLSADGLFAFGRSGFNDLQATGRQRLFELAGQLKSGFKTVRAVDIVGHTDRVGSDASNMRLSIARANTVKQYLVSQGIDGSVIRTSGMGESQPVVFCNGSATPAVVACLMPNRRIEVSVNGDK